MKATLKRCRDGIYLIEAENGNSYWSRRGESSDSFIKRISNVVYSDFKELLEMFAAPAYE
jgi:hypothetical protein